MEIERVKKTTGGFLVNTQFFIPEDENDGYYQDIKKWVAAGGKIEDEFTADELLQKAKCDKIYAINTQRNEILLSNLPINDGEYELKITDDILPKIIGNIAILEQQIADGEELSTVEWITADNEIINLDFSDLIFIRNELINRNVEFIKARRRKDKVIAMRSLSKVRNYDITTIEE
jgi:hypothetical protein